MSLWTPSKVAFLGLIERYEDDLLDIYLVIYGVMLYNFQWLLLYNKQNDPEIRLGLNYKKSRFIYFCKAYTRGWR